MVDIEIWKPIKGYEDRYMVSTKGRIKSIERVVIGKDGISRRVNEKIKEPTLSPIGYYVVSLWKGNSSRLEYVHRLIATAFIKNPNNYPHINHKDGNKRNNSLENLEWCTHEQNLRHAREHGLFKSRNIAAVDPITFKVIKVYWNAAIAAKETGASRNVICRCCRENHGKSGGIIWRFLENVKEG